MASLKNIKDDKMTLFKHISIIGIASMQDHIKYEQKIIKNTWHDMLNRGA